MSIKVNRATLYIPKNSVTVLQHARAASVPRQHQITAAYALGKKENGGKFLFTADCHRFLRVKTY
jgi:hypothetical protein